MKARLKTVYTHITLTEKEKRILDERRASMAEENFIPWKKAKKQLKNKA